MTTHHQLFSTRLPKVQRWATYLVLAAVAVSGLAWSLLHDFLQWDWMSTERRLLILHGVVAAAALIVIGGLLPLHVRLAWRIRRNLMSGITSLAIISTLALTGLLLYYGGEEWRDCVRWTHLGAGIVATLLIPVHVWMGRRRAARTPAPIKEARIDLKTHRVRA